jgi:hypothetical protein
MRPSRNPFQHHPNLHRQLLSADLPFPKPSLLTKSEKCLLIRYQPADKAPPLDSVGLCGPSVHSAETRGWVPQGALEPSTPLLEKVQGCFALLDTTSFRLGSLLVCEISGPSVLSANKEMIGHEARSAGHPFSGFHVQSIPVELVVSSFKAGQELRLGMWQGCHCCLCEHSGIRQLHRVSNDRPFATFQQVTSMNLSKAIPPLKSTLVSVHFTIESDLAVSELSGIRLL